jgi:hypothetical protein
MPKPTLFLYVGIFTDTVLTKGHVDTTIRCASFHVYSNSYELCSCTKTTQGNVFAYVLILTKDCLCQPIATYISQVNAFHFI